MDARTPSPAAEPWVYLNGQIVPRSAATLSIEDRGTMFADGVYEVARYYAGRPFALDRHVQRLAHSLAAIRIAMHPDISGLTEASDKLVHRNGTPDATLYWQITRGAAPRKHGFPPTGTRPTVLAIAYPAKPVALDAAASSPPVLRAVLAPDVRWHFCSIKTLMLLPGQLARQQAVEAGADEAILHRDGRITEGTATNAFIVTRGVLRTHPADQWILPGVTRAVVLELARGAGIGVREETFTVDDLRTADEVFITGSNTHVSAIVAVDGHSIASESAGPVTVKLHGLLMDRIASECLRPQRV